MVQVGDNVRMLCTVVPGTAVKIKPNSIGVVIGDIVGGANINVIGSGTWGFYHHHFEVIDFVVMEPEMSLDEIHKAQEMMK